MDATMAVGDAAKVLTAKEGEGGFNMYPTTFQFGWQFEKQYLSAGNFQALVECVGLIGGLESGKIIPSLTFRNGFRFGKAGWEFGFGPSFRVIQKATGFYGDGNNNTVKDQWYVASDWTKLNPSVDINPYVLTKRLDSRGVDMLSASLI